MIPNQRIDFNKVNKIVGDWLNESRFDAVIDLCICLCDGDDYFEAGLHAYWLSICYERLGRSYEAKYWAGLAVSQNPQIEQYINQRRKFDGVNILELVKLSDIV